MARLFSSRNKRRTQLQTTHPRSHNSSWFKALEILDESDSQYLVRWAGKNPSTGKEWKSSWELKQDCSPSLVRSWQAIHKMNSSNRQLSRPIPVVRNQALTMLPGTSKPNTVDETADSRARRTSAHLSSVGYPSSNNDTRLSSRHLYRQSTRTITLGRTRTSTSRSISKSRPIPCVVTINSRKRRIFTSPEAPLDSHSGSQDMPRLSTQGSWFEALEILAQDGNKFQVSWVGIDPSTGKGWEPTWVWRKNCSPALLHTWKVKQVGDKKGSGPISLQSELPILRPTTRKPPAISQIENPDPQSFEQVPSEPPPSIDKPATLIRLPRLLRKRNLAFDDVIPAKHQSRSNNSRSPESKPHAVGNASCATEEVPSIPSESPVKHKVTKDCHSKLPTSTISHSQVPIYGTSPSTSVRSAWPNFTPIQTYWLRFARGKEME